ncbi:MAG: hypothetical protein WBF55_20445, partial [Syntrophobacteria bacterium]
FEIPCSILSFGLPTLRAGPQFRYSRYIIGWIPLQAVLQVRQFLTSGRANYICLGSKDQIFDVE